MWDRFQSMERSARPFRRATEELQARRNSLSKQIGQMKAKAKTSAAVIGEVGGIADD